ncbi:MAG: aminotransferase class V-fold PLP-dependent enzyme, partial [Acidilobaceae archaeon]
MKADVEELGKLAMKFDTMFFVDGVSSVAAEIMNCSDWGVDVVITASQKALEVPPGIGILALCSEKAFSAMQEN